jgi:hypothetical protein
VPHAPRPQLPTDRLAVRVVASAVGPVTENDIVRWHVRIVSRADALVGRLWHAKLGQKSSRSMFVVRPAALMCPSPVWQCDADAGLLEMARQAGVVVTRFDLIYELFDHIRGRLSDLLPVEVLAHSHVRAALRV